MKDIDYKKIGKQIRSFREMRKWSQEMLAEKAALSKVHISHIETGHTKLSLQALVRIANALQVSSDELLCEDLVMSAPIYHNKMNQLFSTCSAVEIRIAVHMCQTLINELRGNCSLLPSQRKERLDG